MDESITKYELVAAFLIALARLIYDGPKLFDGKPLEVDQVTALHATALAMRIGELTGQEPVTRGTFADRMRQISGHTEHAPRFEPGQPIGWVTVCVSGLYGGPPSCFKFYEPGSVLQAPGEVGSEGL
jgi:hypothetical protein